MNAPTLIDTPPQPGLSLVVTIPCYDEPDLLRTLNSLATCSLPSAPVEVIVVINSAENATVEVKNRNTETFEKARAWALANSARGRAFHFLHTPDLPPKHAGVGLARRIAMDEAVRRLRVAGSPRGVVACLDADSRVQPDYLQAIHRFFEQNPACPAAGIHYEHPLDGDEFGPDVYEAIARYELHLRYYVHALLRAGLAAATQTVGSAMAVRADAYLAQGGMNRRQAGEDFYFLHKFTPLDHFGEIVETTVIPSPRPSHRVPFGTGKAVGDMLSGGVFLTYSPLIFRDLEVFLKKSETCFAHSGGEPAVLPASVTTFLEKENFEEKLREIRTNTASPDAFRRRFFRWFDPFRAMKLVHHARDGFYPGVPVEEAAREFLQETGDVRELLERFRALDRRGEKP